MKLGRSLFVVLTGMLVSSAALATDPFSITLSDGSGTPIQEGFSNIQSMLNQLTQAQLEQLFGDAASSTAPITAQINMRGLTGVSLSFAANSNTLTFSIPSLGISQSFTGSSRDESEHLLQQYLKGSNSLTAIKQLSNALVAASPIDPVAGNPGSLMSGMASADLTLGSAASTSDISATAGVGAGVGGTDSSHNFLAMEAHFGSYTQHGYETQLVTLPFTYTHEFSDPRYGLIIDMPLTYMKSNGAESGSGSIGLGLRMPASDNWTLTPIARAGVAASQDLGAAGSIFSGSVMSDYRFLNKGVNIGLLNMVSYYKTEPLKIGAYTVGPNLTNMVYRNGFDFSGTGFTINNNPTTWSAQLVRTDFTGDQLFCAYSDDFSMSIGTTRRKGQTLWNSLRVGFTYTYADRGIRGFGVNTGYTF